MSELLHDTFDDLRGDINAEFVGAVSDPVPGAAASEATQPFGEEFVISMPSDSDGVPFDMRPNAATQPTVQRTWDGKARRYKIDGVKDDDVK